MGKFYMEQNIHGGNDVIEKDGTFYNEGSQDLIIGSFENEAEAKRICDMLNDHIKLQVFKQVFEQLMEKAHAEYEEHHEAMMTVKLFSNVQILSDSILKDACSCGYLRKIHEIDEKKCPRCHGPYS